MTKQKKFETEFLTLCDGYEIDACEMGIVYFDALWKLVNSIPVEAEVSQLLMYMRSEFIAGKSIIELGGTWNRAHDRCISILDKYKKGEGLFQQKTG